MILAVLLVATAQSAPAAAPPARAVPRGDRCMVLATESPDAGVADANAWRIEGGGFRARQCLGVAYAALGRWQSAATAFEAAAREAEAAGDDRAPAYWAQAGNALLAGGEPARARAALDAALARPALVGAQRGEAHLDRARALVAAGDMPGARADLDKALQLVPADPLAWLLSAVHARRAGNLPGAQKDIDEALRLASDDAQVRLEAGNIAALTGDEAQARAHWTAATTVQPGSPAAASARVALAQFEAAAAP